MEQKQKGGNSQPLNWLKNKRLQEDTGGIGSYEPVVFIEGPDPNKFELTPDEYKKEYEEIEKERRGDYGTN